MPCARWARNPAVVAAASKDRVTAQSDDVRASAATASIPATPAAVRGDAKVRRPDAIAPKRPAGDSPSVGRLLKATSQPGTTPEPGATLRIQVAERGAHEAQRLADDIAVVRPTADRGVAARSSRATALHPDERRALPDEDGPTQQGALLPVAMPAQRLPFAQSAAAQRQNRPQPLQSDAHEASPPVVNVTHRPGGGARRQRHGAARR